MRRYGAGSAFLAEDRAEPYQASGALGRLLEDWSPPFAGFLYDAVAGSSPPR